jgi:hypothetical protein
VRRHNGGRARQHGGCHTCPQILRESTRSSGIYEELFKNSTRSLQGVLKESHLKFWNFLGTFQELYKSSQGEVLKNLIRTIEFFEKTDITLSKNYIKL